MFGGCRKAKNLREHGRKDHMCKKTGLVRLAVLSVIVLALIFGTVDGWAQGGTPAPFNKVTVSSDVAKRTLMKAVINADTARAIVDSCGEWQKAQPAHVTFGSFVLPQTARHVDS